METRKDTLNALKLCRFCLTQDEPLTSLYDRRRAPKNAVPLPLKILSCVSIEVFPSDRMPSYICNRCKFFMEISYDFKQLCRQADENALEFIQTGTDLCSVKWPATLQKLYRGATKSTPILKTVVEGGATVQVTAQESDSEEEDDGNVYNIKMEDGSDECPKSARVKIITADKEITEKTKPNSEDEYSDTQSAVDSTSRDKCVSATSKLQDGRWACDECNCTYPLQQLLELHKKQKHRQRTVQCNQCNDQFYSNYDLATHQLRHSSEELIFQCVACDKKFKRHILLKRHEKLMHSDLAQLPCPFCPASFLSREELEAHQEKHLNAKEKRFACDVCDKRFHEKSTLQRHKANVHDKEEAFACVYCPARFSSVSKLTTHVRSHAGVRAYPCKHCDKSFLKSHHYTRHLRVKHRNVNRTCRGPFGSVENYRCEQCEDSFITQDELIYHSAIHATQNLICPLCQEKFEDVDAVTAHIKSHVNGTEFMCDLCELVFTSKEKLDSHTEQAHDDEIGNENLDQDESEMEIDEDEDDAGINVKEESDHMVVEIKKADEFTLPSLQDDTEEKNDNINSEESESEIYNELSTEDTSMTITTEKVVPEKIVTESPIEATVTKVVPVSNKITGKNENQSTPILKKAEEIKRKVPSAPEPTPEMKINKSESNNTGASDKSLRLLEKELQELKRTNIRTEFVKSTTRLGEMPRHKRIPIHTSTPKIRSAGVEEKKIAMSNKSLAIEKKLSEKRIVTKENKEPRDLKETKSNNGTMVKEEKDKEIKEKDIKEKETPKATVSQIKNNVNEKGTPEEGIRRSTRPSKIKDYAKMIRDRTQESDQEDLDDIDEEYKESEKNTENKVKARRPSVKASPKQAPVSGPAPAPAPNTPAAATPAPRKRGRPRKDASLTLTPAKVKKEDVQEAKPVIKLDENKKENETNQQTVQTSAETDQTKKATTNNVAIENKTASEELPSGVFVSPTGQTLKKIPIKALPPGITPIPLPRNARPVGASELCKMQFGKKLVNVQKIVMTKAEVEAMTKKGLVHMKDGTMVLKQGVKLPTSDSMLKSLVADDTTKESPKKEKGTPTRCDIDEEV